MNRMRISQDPFRYATLALTLILSCATWGQVPSPSEASTRPPVAEPPESSIESLNLIGSETVMPPFSESPIDIHSDFRQKLWGQGVALRGLVQSGYAQNMLQAPVPADEQVYVGEHPYGSAMTNWTLTSDLRQWHLKQTQLYICGVWNWVSWNPAGPKAFQIYGLYLYKAFGEDRVEIKAGYIGNNLEIIGLTVGGSAATGAQGVYAVLPFEVGLSYFPLTTPSLNFRVRGPKNTYLKTVAQRSLDPEGGPVEVERNHTGFRFIPHGDNLLLVGEAGYLRRRAAGIHETWMRAGYMHNRTPYTDFVTGTAISGNHVAFALADYQVRQPSPSTPDHGLYLGGTAMAADSRFNAYDSYYELRLYQKAPFRSRPFDMASMVAYYTGHSSQLTDSLVALGNTVWRDGASVTGSYALRIHPGQYLNTGLSYVHGPAITPRVNAALTFPATYSVFF